MACSYCAFSDTADKHCNAGKVAKELAQVHAVGDPREQNSRTDFLIVACRLAPCSVVTLDRVVCCYPSYEPLLTQALNLASTAVAMSYPRNRWFVRPDSGSRMRCVIVGTIHSARLFIRSRT